MLEVSHFLRRLCMMALVAAVLAVATPHSGRASTLLVDPILQEQLLDADDTSPLSIILTYDTQPAGDDLARLVGLGVPVAPLQSLPIVGALATPSQLDAIFDLPGLMSVYANEPLEIFLNESVVTIGAPGVWQDYGYEGDGVGVAILDTGIDATHPDLGLGEETVQNVKLLGLQYAAGVDLDQLNLPTMYIEDQPNTDTTGGHGTHVAGIAGASGNASAGYYRGVAPKADLIGLGAGEGIEIFTALAGFDWAITHRNEYNIRVINCSWGNIVPGFDPNNPVNVASRRAHDANIAVVFSSGNSGSGTDTLNTYSVAPWVIGVAAGENDGQTVSFFSSRGIPGDSFYHPTLTAPGYMIVSDRASTGLATSASTTATDAAFIAPQHLPYYTAASGTSMAAPHVSGAIALMVEAKPELTPDLIKQILVNTATPTPDFQEYAAGAGYLNVRAAVETARSIRSIRSYRDPATNRWEEVFDLTEQWSGTIDASLPGRSATHSRPIVVQPGTLSLEVTVDWDIIANDLNLYLYDPQGTLAGKSEVIQAVYNYANETVHISNPSPGEWRAEIRGFVNTPQTVRAISNSVVLVHQR